VLKKARGLTFLQPRQKFARKENMNDAIVSTKGVVGFHAKYGLYKTLNLVKAEEGKTNIAIFGATVALVFLKYPQVQSFRLSIDSSCEFDDQGRAYTSYSYDVSGVLGGGDDDEFSLEECIKDLFEDLDDDVAEAVQVRFDQKVKLDREVIRALLSEDQISGLAVYEAHFGKLHSNEMSPYISVFCRDGGMAVAQFEDDLRNRVEAAQGFLEALKGKEICFAIPDPSLPLYGAPLVNMLKVTQDYIELGCSGNGGEFKSHGVRFKENFRKIHECAFESHCLFFVGDPIDDEEQKQLASSWAASIIGVDASKLKSVVLPL